MLVANYETKKALKEAIGQALNYTETSMFGPEFRLDGVNIMVGPSAYKRKFYAEVSTQKGIITKVK